MSEEEEKFYVALRAAQMQVPPIPSVKLVCSECGESVWVDKKVERLWSTLPVLCLKCALVKLEAEGGTFAVAPETIKSMMEFMINRDMSRNL